MYTSVLVFLKIFQKISVLFFPRPITRKFDFYSPVKCVFSHCNRGTMSLPNLVCESKSTILLNQMSLSLPISLIMLIMPGRVKLRPVKYTINSLNPCLDIWSCATGHLVTSDSSGNRSITVKSGSAYHLILNVTAPPACRVTSVFCSRFNYRQLSGTRIISLMRAEYR